MTTSAKTAEGGGGARSPYRQGKSTSSVSVSKARSLVDDVVGQFADRYAFYRELVQNAIDAGSPSVRITVVHDPGEKELRVSVVDEGSGMDRDILENTLVVLFRSTKEGLEDAIGKFGIGFVSVLAVAPREVVVRTRRDGTLWTLRLSTDFRYTIDREPTELENGTTVSLFIPATVSEAEEFIEASRQALDRWCGHAWVPIHFRATPVPGQPPTFDEEIQRPLRFENALVQVEVLEPGEEESPMRAVVAILKEGTTSAAYYNHGLNLYHGSVGAFRGVAFKVQGRGLGHTLSRDNVRHDAAYMRARELVKRALHRELREAVIQQIADGAEEGRKAHHRVVKSISEALHSVSLKRSDWHFPLIESVGGVRAVSLSEWGMRALYCATRKSSITHALQKRGVAVLDVGGSPAQRARVRELLASLRVNTKNIEQRYAFFERVECEGYLRVWLERSAELLDRVWKEREIVLVRGRCAQEMFCAAGKTALEGDGLTELDELGTNPFATFRSGPVMIVNEHPLTKALMQRARLDPTMAAFALVRAILSWYEGDKDRRAEKLFDAAMRMPGATEHQGGGE